MQRGHTADPFLRHPMTVHPLRRTTPALLAALLTLAIAFHLVAAHAHDRTLHPLRSIGRPWSGANQWMGYVAFSPDGRQIVTDGAGVDGKPHGLTVWRFADGAFVRNIEGTSSGLSSDWRLAVRWHDDIADPKDTIRKEDIVDLDSGKSLLTMTGFSVPAFSRDARYLAATPDANGTPVIHVLSLPDAKPVASYGTHATQALAISPDDHLLATGHWRLVMLRELTTGRRIGVLRGFDRYVSSLGFSPDGRRLVAVTDLGNLQIWDVRTRRRLHVVQLDGDEPSPPAFSRDGRRVAVGMYGTGTAYVIDLHSGRVIAHAKPSGLGCGAVAFSPDGRYLITPSTGGLVTWPPDDGGGVARVYRLP